MDIKSRLFIVVQIIVRLKAEQILQDLFDRSHPGIDENPSRLDPGREEQALQVEGIAGAGRILDLAEDLRISQSLEAAGPTTFQIYDL